MIAIVKFLISIFDYFTQKKIIIALSKKIRDKKINLFIDVGFHKGEYYNSLNSKFNIQKTFAFEPNPKIFEKLEINISDRIKIFNYGISNKNCFVKFNQNIESSSSSINDLNINSKYYKKKFLLLNFFNLKKVNTKIDVQVKRLDEFFNQNKITEVDLLKIDTEGNEYNVLESLGDKISKVKIIHFEHHFDDMIIKNYKFSDIHNLLIKNGFKKYFKIKMKFRKSFEYIYINNLKS